MALTWKYRGETFTAESPEEMMKIRELVKKEESAANHKRAELRFFARMGRSALSGMPYLIAEEEHAMAEEEARAWTPERFISLIDHLGKPQQAALALLVSKRQVTDQELRTHLKVSGNQALAGVLSGISKQAASLGIPARAIFGFENLRSDGKRRSTYTVAEKFLQIATDMNWPGA